MRKVFQLIRSYWNIILFVLLEVFCFSLIGKRNSTQGVDIINSSNSIVGYFYQKQHDIVYYFQLKETNKELLKENALLRNQIGKMRNIDTFTNQLAYIPIRPIIEKQTTDIADSNIKPTGAPTVVQYSQYEFIPARVINNSIANDRMNFITLNRGTNAGIQKDMAVVTSSGIVGRVSNVSANYATVVSVLSEDRKYSVRLSDGTGGLMVWKKGSADYTIVGKIPLEEKVKKGDSVFTVYSFFPADIFIGTVKKIDIAKTDNTKNLTIKLSTNFRNLQFVYVVKDKLGEEKKRIEATNKQPQ